MNIITLINAFFVKSVYAQETVTSTLPIPSLPEIITFLVRIFFTISGLAALLYLLLGAFSWITSAGNKENVQKAQEKIQAAIIGLLLIVVVLAIGVTLEQFVFNKEICLGISCPITIPSLLKK